MGAGETPFGPFMLDRNRMALLRDGKVVAVGQRALALLGVLASADGPVSKEALLNAAWPDVSVEEGNLTVQIAALRKALGPREDGSEWIVTVPRVGYRLVRGDPRTLTARPGLPTLAVRPFECIGTDGRVADFAGGLIEDLFVALGRFKAFELRSRSAADDNMPADYLVEGSVRRSGEQVRIAARLVSGATGSSVWSHTFDGDLNDGFELQDSIASVAAAHVSRVIRQTEWNRSARQRPASKHAYDLVQRGIALLEAIGESRNREAIALLEEAVTLEPENPTTLAMASWAYEQRIHAGWTTTSKQEARCLDLTRAAITFGGDDASILGHCGVALQLCGGEWENGLQTALRGVQINPNSTTAIFFAGVAHLCGGTLAGAREHFERALHLATDDEAGNPTAGLAHVLICEARYEEALPLAERGVAMRPRFFWAHWAAIVANARLGRTEAAQRALTAYRAADPDAVRSLIEKGQRSREPGRHANLLDGLRLAGMPG